MDGRTLTAFIKQLQAELEMIDRVILHLERLARLASGKPLRGRPRKLASRTPERTPGGGPRSHSR